MNNKMLVLGLDAAVAAGLMGLLIAVIGLDSLLTHFYPPEEQSPVASGGTTPTTKKFKRARLAVTHPYAGMVNMPGGQKRVTWDDVGTVLKSMGEGYKHDVIEEGDLSNLDKLRQYDILFCSCSAATADPTVAKNLAAFVQQGGTLYASDWRYNVVAQAFPEMRDPDKEASGLDEYVWADVVDPGLREQMGNKVQLHFELNEWRPAAFKGDRVKVLLKGRFTDIHTQRKLEAPLLVKFTHGKGNVIFTSYHHGHNNTEMEKKLLKYLVYSLMTARLETEIETTHIESQFSPAKSNLFSASKEDPKVTYKYHNPAAGKLRFDLGFAGEGADLKLTVRAPGGKIYEKQGTSSFAVEVPNGEVGEWTYTVTALAVPYENFAFVVTVANGKK